MTAHAIRPAAGWVTSLVGVEAMSIPATGPARLDLPRAGVLEELASRHASSLGQGVGAEWEGLVVVPFLAEVFLGMVIFPPYKSWRMASS